MNYCILRTKKLSTFGAIAGSAKHTFREIPTPNADPTRAHLNKTIGAKDSTAVRGPDGGWLDAIEVTVDIDL